MKTQIAGFAVALQFLMLPLPAFASPPAEEFMPEVPYYSREFNPEQRPWEPGQKLNIEEVFKDYQYYEIVIHEGGEVMTVSRYVRGEKAETQKYFRSPDGSLKK